ncbi:hypothetical protein CYMTET_33981 [Cymbomonas tetramitiformis]|uniref:Uncharacterized protein n=1 Tax=Cymbomonas tetramitiformis TaxID=36881 RepID=A0AAE0KQN7_9CHLO|nr:hypothetical protein CYMTET_33981 [Cymbomonas tetramitiformis]
MRLRLEDVLMEENVCYGYGGALSATTALVLLSGITMVGNQGIYAGGAIDCVQANLYADGLHLAYNYAYYDGGGIQVGTGCRMELQAALVEMNRAGGNGGGLQVYGQVVVGLSVFTDCVAEDGAAISFTSLHTEVGAEDANYISNSTFSQNQARGNGAVFYVYIQEMVLSREHQLP